VRLPNWTTPPPSRRILHLGTTEGVFLLVTLRGGRRSDRHPARWRRARVATANQADITASPENVKEGRQTQRPGSLSLRHRAQPIPSPSSQKNPKPSCRGHGRMSALGHEQIGSSGAYPVRFSFRKRTLPRRGGTPPSPRRGYRLPRRSPCQRGFWKQWPPSPWAEAMHCALVWLGTVLRRPPLHAI
jgi:hypothetical protein